MWGCIYFVVFVQRKKKKSKTKRRNKVPQEKKKRKKKSGKEKEKCHKNEVIFLYCFNFNKRLEENKKVVSGIA